MLPKGIKMFHCERNELPEKIEGYFYINVKPEKLYAEKKTKAFDHNFPENFIYSPETGKELWKVEKIKIDIFRDNTIIDPNTKEVLANVIIMNMVSSVYGIGYVIEINKEFKVPYDKIEVLLNVLKNNGIIDDAISVNDFRFFINRDTSFAWLGDVLKKRIPYDGPGKQYMLGPDNIKTLNHT